MTSKFKDGMIYHENHQKPMTRRQLVAQGFKSGAGMVLAPSFLTLLSQKLYAADCKGGSSQEARMTGVIGIDCAGGINLAGSNVIVGLNGSQDQFLSPGGYGTLGVALGDQPSKENVNTELGLMFHARSDMLNGILATTTPETRAKVNGLVFCCGSQDDTGSNPHNPLYWVRSAGLTGSLGGLIGTQNNISGGNSRAPDSSINPTFRPTQIKSYKQARAIVERGRLEELLPGNAERILKAAESMSQNQLQRFASKSMPEQIKELIQCGYLQSRDLLTKFNADSVDPNPGNANPDQEIAAALAIRNSFANPRGYESSLEVEGTLSIAKLVIDGYVGAGTLEIGGCDYHGAPRSVQADKDFEVGEAIGLCLEVAAQKQQNLVLYVFSDGGVRCADEEDLENGGGVRNKPRFSGDDGTRGASMMLVYRHAGKVDIAGSHQLGSYEIGGRVETKPTGTNFGDNSVVRLASAFLINYLAFEGMAGRFEEIVGSNPLGANKNQFIRLTKK